MTDFDRAMELDADDADDVIGDIHDAIRERIDLDLKIADLEEALSGAKQRRSDLDYTILPDLFGDAGVTKIGLDAEGNRPAVEATLKAYYHAKIQASWPVAQKKVAFDRLDALGLSNIVKNVFSIVTSRGEDAEADRIKQLLDDNDIPYEIVRSTPWSTLTAAVKEFYDHGATLSPAILAEIGAVVGRVVKLKTKRD